MRDQILTLPELPKSLNVLLNMQRFARARYKKDVAQLVFMCGKSQKLKPMKRCRMYVSLIFTKRRSRDLDNYLGGMKFIVDGLKDAKFLPDDNAEVIVAITLSFGHGDTPETRIEFEEV